MSRSRYLGVFLIFAIAATYSTSVLGKAKEQLLPKHEFRKGTKKPKGFLLHGACIVDSGITRKERHSKPSSAFLELDLGKDSWGAIMLREEGVWDLTEATLSIHVMSSSSFESYHGLIGFKLIDADGTEYRTDNADLFQPKTEFTEFKQKVNELYCVDAAGKEIGLDLTKIVQYGIIFLDRGDHEQVATFYLDDFHAARDGDTTVADKRQP